MSNSQKGSVSLYGALFVLLVSGTALTSIIPVQKHYLNGSSQVQGTMLSRRGDDSESSGRSGSSDSSPNSGSSSSGNSSGQDTPLMKIPEIRLPPISGRGSPAPFKDPTTQTGNGPSSLQTRKEVNDLKVKLRQGNLRFEYEVKDGEVKIKAKTDSGEIENEAVKEVEKQVDKNLENQNEVHIATAPGKLAFVKGQAGAISKFPLSLDPVTNSLIVTTPQGSKTVAVLPDKAIQNLLASKVMTNVANLKAGGELGSVPNLVEVEERNGVLVYKVKGTKNHQVLGLLSIKTNVDAFVSAENGSVTEATDSLLGKILDRISF